MRHEERTTDTDELSAQSPTRRDGRCSRTSGSGRTDPSGWRNWSEATGDGRRGQVVSTGFAGTGSIESD